LAYAIHGVVGAPYAGMFALGMLVPWSNTFVSFIPNFWMFILRSIKRKFQKLYTTVMKIPKISRTTNVQQSIILDLFYSLHQLPSYNQSKTRKNNYATISY